MKVIKRFLPILAIVLVTLISFFVNMMHLLIQHNYRQDVIYIIFSMLFVITWLAVSYHYGRKGKYSYLVISSLYFILLPLFTFVFFRNLLFSDPWPFQIFLQFPLIAFNEISYNILRFFNKDALIMSSHASFLTVGVLFVLNLLVFFFAKYLIKTKNSIEES